MSEEILEYCCECDIELPVSELIESRSGYFCEECYEPVCLECSSPMPDDEESDFCSKQCYKDYMSDLWEDDYKDK